MLRVCFPQIMAATIVNEEVDEEVDMEVNEQVDIVHWTLTRR